MGMDRNIEMINIELIRENARKYGCLVVGDIILDKYINGEATRISPEAPIPVLRVLNEGMVLGGAANVAGNANGYLVNTYLAGMVGDDNESYTIETLLMKSGIHFIGDKSIERCTTLKTRIMGKNQQLVRVDREDTNPISEEEALKLIKQILDILSKVGCVVISDYNKGVCTEFFCQKLITLCNERRIPIIVDPKSSDWSKYVGADLITPNFKEFEAAIGKNIDNTEEEIVYYAKGLLDRYRLERVLVTRSQFGMTIVESGTAKTFNSIQKEVFDVSGAGDTVVGTIAALVANKYNMVDAIEIANIAAGLSVSKVGTYMVTLEEVIDYMSLQTFDYADKIIDGKAISKLVEKWKQEGEKIVFTNGCFDIIHMGHVEYLKRASRLGTKIIVGLNSDSSVRRLKGNLRPINNEWNRATMLAALQCVDVVVIFSEDTPEKLLSNIYPDVLVKGGDYAMEDIIGTEYAREVKIMPLVEGVSTTYIIEKIRENKRE